MKSGTYVTEVGQDLKISIPKDLIGRIGLSPGDKLEILIKKIRSGKRLIATADSNLLDVLKIGKDEA